MELDPHFDPLLQTLIPYPCWGGSWSPPGPLLGLKGIGPKEEAQGTTSWVQFHGGARYLGSTRWSTWMHRDVHHVVEV